MSGKVLNMPLGTHLSYHFMDQMPFFKLWVLFSMISCYKRSDIMVANLSFKNERMAFLKVQQISEGY